MAALSLAGSAMNRWVVAYDVADDRRRARLARLLEGHGERIQASVFEVTADERTLGRLAARAQRTIDPRVDKVRVYPLCGACAGKIADWGARTAEPFDVPALYVV